MENVLEFKTGRSALSQSGHPPTSYRLDYILMDKTLGERTITHAKHMNLGYSPDMNTALFQVRELHRDGVLCERGIPFDKQEIVLESVSSSVPGDIYRFPR